MSKQIRNSVVHAVGKEKKEIRRRFIENTFELDFKR